LKNSSVINSKDLRKWNKININKYKQKIYIILNMATLKVVRETYDRDPCFKERVQQLVSAISVSIYDLENLYTETFNLEASH